MATGYLTVNPNTAYCTSTWTATWHGTAQGETITYSTPTTQSSNVTVTIPEEMRSATINSVTLTYSGSGGSGTKRVCYSGGAVTVTNVNLLETVQGLIEAGTNYSFGIYFSFKATGGTGTATSSTPTCTYSSSYYWQNISIAVDYTPSAGLSQTITVTDGGTAILSVNDASLAYGESTAMSCIVRPTAAITGWTVEVKPGNLSVADSYTTARTVAASSSASADYTLTMSSEVYAVMTDRVYQAQVRVTFLTSDGSYTSGWVNCESGDTALQLIKTRVSPAISNISWSESGTTHLTLYGNYVGGKTIPVLSFDVTLDTAADPDVAIASRSLTIENRDYTLSSNGGTIDALTSGTLDYTISVTDTHGSTGTYSSTLTVLSYTRPKITGLAIDRYVTSLNAQGQTIYELDDDGEQVWLDAQIEAQTTLGTGTNTWSLTVTPSGGSAITVLSNSNLDTKTFLHDRTAITGTFSNISTYDFTVELSDTFTTVTNVVSIPKAGGIFNIESTGVAVGKRSTGTSAEPLFEVAYKTYFNNTVYDKDGYELSGAPQTDDTGWVTNGVTLTNCLDSDASRVVGIRKKNGIVFFRGAILLNSALSSGAGSAGQVQIGTIDQDYWPDETLDFPIVLAKTNGYLRMIVGDDGTLTLHNYSGYSIGATTTIPLAACWCADA